MARLNEDEAAADDIHDAACWSCTPGRFTGDSTCTCDIPARMLREVAAKRAILAEHYILARGDRNPVYEQFSIISPPFPPEDCGCVTCHYASHGGVNGYGICRTVRALAAIWSDHPGYGKEWAIR